MSAIAPSGKPMNIVVVGGRSRSGEAFRRYAATLGLGKISVLTRQPVTALPGETVILVSDYFAPPSDVLRSADMVVNFAGIARDASPSELRAINVEGPRRLARKARESGVRHLVHISSLHIYGDPEVVDRTTPENPLSDYARSKQAADVALSAEASDAFAITMLRVPMHYGPTAGEKLHRLAAVLVKLGWFPAPRREIARSVLHLDNLAAAIVALARDPRGGIQFAADPEHFRIEALAQAAAESGRSIKIVRLPEILFWPLQVFAKGLYRRLYKSNVIAEAVLLKLVYPVKLKDGLKDILP